MPPEPSQARLAGCVAVGGALGGLVRWVLTSAFPDGPGVPWTTWWINVTGAVALAALPLLLARRAHRHPHGHTPGRGRRQLLAAFLGPGFLGGYTTLSAYALVARDGLARGDLVSTAVMLLGTLTVSVAAVAGVRRWEHRGRAATGRPVVRR